MLPFNHELAKPFHDLLSEKEMASSWQLVEPDGTRLCKKPAAVRLLEHLSVTRWIARVLKALHLTWLAGLGYEFFNLSRGHLSKITPKVEPPVRWP